MGVIPFRKRPPSEAEMRAYRIMTRNWSDEMRRLICPEYWAQDRRQREA